MQDGLERRALCSKTIQHPIPGPIELDDESTELLGNRRWDEGLPEFLGTIIENWVP